MSRPLYSISIGALYSTTGVTLLSVVPPGVIWIVRDIDGVVHGSGTATDATVGWQDAVPNTGLMATYPVTATGYTTIAWRGRQVLQPGWRLYVNAGYGSGYFLVSGYQLTQP